MSEETKVEDKQKQAAVDSAFAPNTSITNTNSTSPINQAQYYWWINPSWPGCCPYCGRVNFERYYYPDWTWRPWGSPWITW